MQRVTTVNLNGRAYQLEEGAYQRLQTYLDQAAGQLGDNPDRAEILADFEQAIADKCDRRAGGYKTVVTTADMTRVLEEMGPVVSDTAAGAADPSAPSGEPDSGTDTRGEDGPRPRKRLYRVPDGRMFAGVCTGLAAYTGIDVSIFRLIYVILIVVGFPWAALLYLAPMFVLPEARSSAEVASAHGEPFSARDLMEQAKRTGADLKDQARETGAAWRRQWKAERRRWRARRRTGRRWREDHPDDAWVAPPAAAWAFASRAPALIRLAWLVAIVAAIVWFVRTPWLLRPGLPIWAVILVLILVLHVVTAPRYYVRPAAWPGPLIHPWIAVARSLLGMAFLLLTVWVLYQHMPPPEDVSEFLRQVPDAARAVARELARWIEGLAGPG